jgi:hypothetical protein
MGDLTATNLDPTMLVLAGALIGGVLWQRRRQSNG